METQVQPPQAERVRNETRPSEGRDEPPPGPWATGPAGSEDRDNLIGRIVKCLGHFSSRSLQNVANDFEAVTGEKVQDRIREQAETPPGGGAPSPLLSRITDRLRQFDADFLEALLRQLDKPAAGDGENEAEPPAATPVHDESPPVAPAKAAAEADGLARIAERWPDLIRDDLDPDNAPDFWCHISDRLDAQIARGAYACLADVVDFVANWKPRQNGQGVQVAIRPGMRVHACKNEDDYRDGVVTSVTADGCFVREDGSGDVFGTPLHGVMIHPQQALE